MERIGAFQRITDSLHHSVEICMDLAVPESQRTEAGPAQDRIAHGVVVGLSVFSVLAAIDLDDQALAVADEVQIEALERRLAAEVEALRPQHPKLEPETRFLRRHGFAELTGTRR
ncbi:MAG TPA: hypothetical protein VGL58_10150 [Caulobacteraceae bacterium]